MAREQLPHGAVTGVMQLPPYPLVQAALRATTERLASEAAVPQQTGPDWTDFEWRTARAVAAMHGISGLLAGRLLWHGPPGWRDFLAEQHEQIAQRQTRLEGLLECIGASFLQLEIPVQALKGAALLARGLYHPGERPMADLDLLVAPRHALRAAAALEQLGLHESHRTLKHRVFEPRHVSRPQPFGEGSANDLKVELHERICEPLPLRLADITPLVLANDVGGGLTGYPSSAALMAHLLLHAAGTMVWRTLRTIQLHDIALLARSHSEQDWLALIASAPHWAWAPLALTERYYGPLVPAAVMARARALSPAMLRHSAAGKTLSDVSLSRLWIEPFPGIEWSRSTGEALGFMARRLVPDASVLADRKLALKSDPSLADSEWGRSSQLRRIVRVLRRRAPRPWTLHNVRAALAQPH